MCITSKITLVDQSGGWSLRHLGCKLITIQRHRDEEVSRKLRQSASQSTQRVGTPHRPISARRIKTTHTVMESSIEETRAPSDLKACMNFKCESASLDFSHASSSALAHPAMAMAQSTCVVIFRGKSTSRPEPMALYSISKCDNFLHRLWLLLETKPSNFSLLNIIQLSNTKF